MHRVRGKLTYANVMATIAVFIALGGAGYAANPPADQTPTQAAEPVRCPEGMVLFGGTCFETALREPSSFGGALDRCARKDLRLPTEAELRAFLYRPHGDSQALEWTGQEFEGVKGGQTVMRALIMDRFHIVAEDATGRHPYRCVTTPGG